MVFYRKKTFRKRRVWKKPGNSKKLNTLAKRVNQLSKVQRSRALYGRYGTELETAVATGIFSHGFTALNLTIPNNWTSIFDNPTDVNGTYSVKTLSYTLDNLFTSGSHLEPVNYTYYVVSLVPSTAMSLLNDTGGDLNSLINGRHYSTLGALTLLNSKYFKTHFTKRFVITSTEFNDGFSGGSNPRTTYKRFTKKINFPRKIVSDNVPWKSLQKDDIKPASRLYILCFYNSPESFGSNTQTWKLNIVNTVVH